MRMRTLSPEVRLSLEKINFIDRYRNISAKFAFDFDECFEKYDIKEILGIFSQLGYNVTFHKKENFFQLVEEVTYCKFYFHISVRYGVVEFIWYVLKNNESQQCGPWGGTEIFIRW
jgi:hypothetical protein